MQNVFNWWKGDIIMLQYYIKRQSCSCAPCEGVWENGGLFPPIVKLGTNWGRCQIYALAALPLVEETPVCTERESGAP